ncbi:MAG: hypothetical protein C0609_06610 [Deltaproteobacteria bacterium]|nr:MAG: hypothetical protein C0609_06610 [Deltaproteobacteria bacterium]
MLKKFLVAFAFSSLLPITAQAFELGVQGIYWAPTFDASLAVDGGTSFDPDDDFDVSDENFIGFRAFAGLGSHHFSLSAFDFAYSGTDFVTQNIDFGGTSIVTVGTEASMDLDYTMVDLAYRYDLIDLENVAAGFSIGPVLQAKLFDGTLEVTNEESSNTESTDFSAVVPMVGVGLHVGILADLLELRAQVTGMGYDGNNIIDAFGEVVFSPLPLVEIAAGYRTLQIDVEADDVDLDVDKEGIYGSIGISF